MRQPKLIFTTILILFGIFFIGASTYIFNDIQTFIEKSLSTTGTVIRLSEEFDDDNDILFSPIVRFETIKGKIIEFKSTTSSNPPSHRVGENVSVLYDPKNPYNAKINSFTSLWLAPILFLGLGIIFSGIGSFIFIDRLKSKKKANWLLMNGRKLTSEIKSIESDLSGNFLGQSPNKIYSQWLDPLTNNIHNFESEEIWFDLKDLVKSNTIDVYVDPINVREYYMDISFLSKKNEKIDHMGKTD